MVCVFYVTQKTQADKVGRLETKAGWKNRFLLNSLPLQICKSEMFNNVIIQKLLFPMVASSLSEEILMAWPTDLSKRYTLNNNNL